jgi:hypothetical protein
MNALTITCHEMMLQEADCDRMPPVTIHVTDAGACALGYDMDHAREIGVEPDQYEWWYDDLDALCAEHGLDRDDLARCECDSTDDALPRPDAPPRDPPTTWELYEDNAGGLHAQGDGRDLVRAADHDDRDTDVAAPGDWDRYDVGLYEHLHVGETNGAVHVATITRDRIAWRLGASNPGASEGFAARAYLDALARCTAETAS